MEWNWKRQYGKSDSRKMKKYTRGHRPCYNCQMSRHVECRPRLDGTLCTCSCTGALMIRDEMDRMTQKALDEGTEPPTIQKVVEIHHPRWKQRF